MEQNRKIILVLDDEETILAVFQGLLDSLGYEVFTAQDGVLGWMLYKEKRPDAVFCDLLMPGMDGLAFLAKVKSDNPFLPFIVVSGKSDLEDAVEAMRNGAWDFLVKPIDGPEQLQSSLHRVWERASFLKMRREYQEELEAAVRTRTAELQHRVKNNLQIILILLDLQRENTLNVEARELLWESQNRIHAMAQIQDQAFDGEKKGFLLLRAFLSGLVWHLVAASGWEDVLSVEWDMEEIEAGAGKAFLVGLIINEIVTALLTIDVPRPQRASLRFQCRSQGDGGLSVRVSDSWGALREWNPGIGSLSLSTTMLKILVELADGQMSYDSHSHEIAVVLKSSDRLSGDFGSPEGPNAKDGPGLSAQEGQPS
ncbi:MAG: response regulator [Spirochaetales bacterium]|nr:response regulator [Spirochaetales bacterium]